MNGLFSEDFVIRKISPAVGAGTSAVTAIIDLGAEGGADGVVLLASIGTANVANGLKAAAGQESNGGDAADLAGSHQLSDGTKTDFVLDIRNPPGRYVTAEVIRGVSTTVEAIWAILYKGHSAPVSNVTSAQEALALVGPAYGTA